MQGNPFDGIAQTRIAKSKKWHYVTAGEYRRLMEACTSLRWQGILCLAYCCGLRVGEVLNLTWSDTDFGREELRVTAKAGQEGQHAWSPKDKDSRLVPLATEVVVLLTRLYPAADEGQVYLFTIGKGPNVGDRMKRNNVWRDFQALRRRAGLPKCTMHDLRKTWCTNLAGELPMHVVQELAGHSDIRTTRQFYVKVPPEQMTRARRAVDALARAKGGQE